MSKCDVYDGSEADDKFIIEVEEECSVILSGGSGRDVYTVGISPKSTITVTDFNITTDVIDLSLFKEIKSIKDVNMTRGSVYIHLPGAQTIILLHCDPVNMTAKHFSFAGSRNGEDATTVYMIAFIASLIVLVVCVFWHFCSEKLLEYDGPVKRSKVTPLKEPDIESGQKPTVSFAPVLPDPASESLHSTEEKKGEGLERHASKISIERKVSPLILMRKSTVHDGAMLDAVMEKLCHGGYLSDNDLSSESDIMDAEGIFSVSENKSQSGDEEKDSIEESCYDSLSDDSDSDSIQRP